MLKKIKTAVFFFFFQFFIFFCKRKKSGMALHVFQASQVNFWGKVNILIGQRSLLENILSKKKSEYGCKAPSETKIEFDLYLNFWSYFSHIYIKYHGWLSEVYLSCWKTPFIYYIYVFAAGGLTKRNCTVMCFPI